MMERDLTLERESIRDQAHSAVISKSEAFKQLAVTGMKVGEISRFMGSHYSFVYGVVMAGAPRAERGPSKSDMIRDLAAQGLTAGQIAKELNSNYSFVHSVIRAYRKGAGV